MEWLYAICRCCRQHVWKHSKDSRTPVISMKHENIFPTMWVKFDQPTFLAHQLTAPCMILICTSTRMDFITSRLVLLWWNPSACLVCWGATIWTHVRKRWRRERCSSIPLAYNPIIEGELGRGNKELCGFRPSNRRSQWESCRKCACRCVALWSFRAQNLGRKADTFQYILNRSFEIALILLPSPPALLPMSTKVGRGILIGHPNPFYCKWEICNSMWGTSTSRQPWQRFPWRNQCNQLGEHPTGSDPPAWHGKGLRLSFFSIK